MRTAAREVFDDLLNLEIDIILKNGMTARKMPDVPHALIDIFTDYDIWMCAHAPALNEAWGQFLASDEAKAILDAPPPNERLIVGGDGEPKRWKGLIQLDSLYDEHRAIGYDDFDKLRDRASDAAEMYRYALQYRLLPDDDTSIILKRIYRNCDQIKGILKGRSVDGGERSQQLEKVAQAGITRADASSTDLPLTADEVLIIRKAWEVGTETVVMQTVVQLDGDIITRVQKAHAAAGDSPIHELHRNAVANALEHWEFLVRTLAEMTAKFTGFLSR